MFEGLSEKIGSIFKRLKGRGVLTPENIAEALNEVRITLLDADVNLNVVKGFIERVQSKAVGEKVLNSITPGQQVIKIVYDEITALMGQNATGLKSANIPPLTIMVAGLQGSGKTTFAAKLAKYVKAKGKKPLLVGADIYRPAALDQLKTLGTSIQVPVFSVEKSDPVVICSQAIDFARKNGCDVAILDTAGRLAIDPMMMSELKKIKTKVKPHEILFVADGMTGQDAVRTVMEFKNQLDIDGVILTKMDGDAQGGAALSIRTVTGKPIKFVSVGEKLDQLEPFYPDRMAARILGMGDIVTLVEKAQATLNQEEAERLSKKLRKLEFTLEDFLTQIQQVKKMGSLDQIMQMIPGAQQAMKKSPDLSFQEKEFKKTEAIIQSMTAKERQRPDILDGSRRLRIAKGSGTQVQDVNRLMKQYETFRKMMKKMMNGTSRSGFPLQMMQTIR